MNNFNAVILMTLAMAGFAIEDMLIKIMANAGMPPGQILTILAVLGCIVFYIWARIQGVVLFSKAFWHPVMILRNIGEAVGTVGFLTAISLSDISTASAILQATPLVVTMGAALFLQEAVGWRRWAAILVGLVGVMMILRPASDQFDPLSLLAVVGVLGLSLRDVATRAMPAKMPTVALSAYSFMILIPVGALQASAMGAPMVWKSEMIFPTLLAAFVGVSAYYAITNAMRMGETAVVTPFRYTRLIFAMAIGIFVFDENPDGWTYVGASIIIMSGLYTLWRERQRRLSEKAKS